MSTQKLLLLKSAYALLENTTPLKYDCGSLCDGICCKDNAINSKGTGMMLLPCEELLLQGTDGFEIKDTRDGKILICNGTCQRDKRPFFCRIFPYYASVEAESGKIRLRIDPRSAGICPIATKQKRVRHSVYFHRNAVRAIRILMRDDDFKGEIIKTSEFCNSLYDLYAKLY